MQECLRWRWRTQFRCRHQEQHNTFGSNLVTLTLFALWFIKYLSDCTFGLVHKQLWNIVCLFMVFGDLSVLAVYCWVETFCWKSLSNSGNLNKHKYLTFWVTFLVKWTGVYYTIECHNNAFIVLISSADGLVLVHHDSQKIKKTVKIYWDSGNKVLDTHFPIQYMTTSCLWHANIIMPSAIWSQVTKMSLRTPDSLYTHTWRLQWDYFGSTLWKIALCIVQFARAVFAVTKLHNIFGHNIDYACEFVWCSVLLHVFQQLFCMTHWRLSF